MPAGVPASARLPVRTLAAVRLVDAWQVQYVKPDSKPGLPIEPTGGGVGVGRGPVGQVVPVGGVGGAVGLGLGLVLGLALELGLALGEGLPVGDGGGEVWPGSVSRCGPTVLAKLYPLSASQLIDHVIAPRIPGQVCDGRNDPQLTPLARQSSALFTTDGAT